MTNLETPRRTGRVGRYACGVILKQQYFATVHFLFAIFSLPGFHVSEVAHDFALQLKTWIVSKGMLNSFDSWHGKCLVFLSHEPILFCISYKEE